MEPNIHENYSHSILPSQEIGPSAPTSSTPSPTGLSTSSSIEESQTVVIPFTAPANSPVLVTPSPGGDEQLRAVTSLSSGDAATIFLMSAELETSNIISHMLDKWNKSIKEQEEIVRQLLNSPSYLALQELRLKGGQTESQVSGITSTHAAARSTIDQINQLASSDRLKIYGHLDAQIEVRDPVGSKDDSKAITIPVTAAVIIGGAIGIGTFEMTTSVNGVSSNPFNGTMEFVNKLQPIIPHLVQDVLPMVNLMIMPLIYFTSWDTSVDNLNNKNAHTDQNVAENFAKEVIKMASTPGFVLVNFVNKMDKAENMTPERKDQLTAIIKLILTSVALSLLYSVEVGKVIKGKFLGMEPQEFKGMLTGNIPIPVPSKDTSASDRMKYTLVNLVKEQLDVLPPEIKAKTLEVLFDYLTQNKNIEDMFQPKKVITSVLRASQYDAEVENLEGSKT